MSKVINLYKEILDFCGLTADESGFISTVLDDRSEPALIQGERLVLPTTEHLRNPKPGEKIIFHPLSENVLRDESVIITKLREILNVRLNFVFGIIGQSLLNLIASPEFHARLNPDQTDLLIAVKDVDETTVRNFVSVMLEAIKRDPTRAFTSIYLKRGGSINGTRYARAGIVSFGMYKELLKDSQEIYGVKVRVKDKEAFKQLYNFIFPKVEDETVYHRGSDSDVAPFLDALLKTAMALAARYNDILMQYGEFIEDCDKLVFNSNWVDDFENLNALMKEIRLIPMQAGNEGTINQQVKQQDAPALPVPQPQVQQQPQPQQWNQQQQQPQWQQQPQPPQVVKTARGVDWRSLQMSNPNLRGPQAFGQFQMNQAQAPQYQRTPSWAVPQYQAGMYQQPMGQQAFGQNNFQAVPPGMNV